MIYLVDSAGARITDQVEMFPGRRGAGKIFHTQVRASGAIPQVCALFGPVRGGRRLHPRVLRLRGDGGRQRLDVPGQPADGRDGGQGEDHAGGDGRRPDALHRVRVRPLPGRARSATRWRRSAGTCPTCRPTGSSSRPRPGPRPGPRTSTWRALVPASERQAFDMRRYLRGLVDAGSFFEIHAAVGAGADHRLRPAGRPGHRRGREQPDVQGRRAVRRLRGQGDPVHPALRRVQRAAAVPGRRARVHGRHGGGEAGHHPARREDDQRGVRGHRAEDLRGGAQGLRGGPVRDGRPGVRAGRHARPAHREDRGDGGRRGRQRGLLQQAGRASPTPPTGRRRRAGCARSTTPTSTCCGWPANWSWTTSWSPASCGRS